MRRIGWAIALAGAWLTPAAAQAPANAPAQTSAAAPVATPPAGTAQNPGKRFNKAAERVLGSGILHPEFLSDGMTQAGPQRVAQFHYAPMPQQNDQPLHLADVLDAPDAQPLRPRPLLRARELVEGRPVRLVARDDEAAVELPPVHAVGHRTQPRRPVAGGPRRTARHIRKTPDRRP